MLFDDIDCPTGLPRLLICGALPAGEEKPRISVVELPRYQALATASQAARSVPWIALPSALDAPPDANDVRLAPPDRQTLAEALANTFWLLLVTDTSPESCALARAIAGDANLLEAGSIAFVQESPASGQPDSALLERSYAVCLCPPTVSPVLAAEALWASIMWQGLVGVSVEDLRSCLSGVVRLQFAPMRQDGPDRVRALLSQLDDLGEPRGIWAVLVLPDSLGLDEFSDVGDHLNEYCARETSFGISVPTTDVLPYGLYLFTC